MNSCGSLIVQFPFPEKGGPAALNRNVFQNLLIVLSRNHVTNYFVFFWAERKSDVK